MLLAVAMFGPIAVMIASGGVREVSPAMVSAAPMTAEVQPCCMEIVAAGGDLTAVPAVMPGAAAGVVQRLAASRWRVAALPPQPLPSGVAAERGLQVRTIRMARVISVVFPEITSIGGVRPDPLPWHPNGLALDVMIPNAGSAQGIALGNQIVAFALKNATKYGIQDAIWRGNYYTPGGVARGGAGHFDHVHITTTGGGYPTGGEVYYR
jgi:hypothetical protein